MESCRKGKRGYRGELDLDYYLEQLPEKDFLIFQGLHLKIKETTFQIDTLIITPSVDIIIESKNFFGHLFFDQYPKQMIRTYEGKEERFPDPLQQAKRHAKSLQNWLVEHKFKPMPIEPLVAIGNPHCIAKTNPGMQDIFKQILHAEYIPDKLLEITAKYSAPQRSPYLIQKLAAHLLHEHQEPLFSILKHYSIKPEELNLHIKCPHCRSHYVERIYGTWHCQTCGTDSPNAHEESIEDYLLLFGSISNQQTRRILNITSIDLARRLLEKMNLNSKGSGKAKKYFLHHC